MLADTIALQRIMLVEDNVLIREMYQMYLEERGFIIGVAGDGEEALVVVKEFQPDLIFLDIMMPKIDGLQVLEMLRSDAQYGCQTCKIVLLTNLGDDTVAEEYKQKIDGYAIKAEITLSGLIDIVKSL